MKRLFRNNIYTEQKSDELRLNQLERRFVDKPVHWAQVRLSGQTITAGSSVLLAWDHFRTTNQLVFSTTSVGGAAGNNTPGDESIRIDAEGIFHVVASVQWSNGTYDRTVTIENGGGETDALTNPDNIPDGASWASVSPLAGLSVSGNHDYQWLQIGAGHGYTHLRVVNFDVSSHDVDIAYLTVLMFQPSGVLYDDTPVY